MANAVSIIEDRINKAVEIIAEIDSLVELPKHRSPQNVVSIDYTTHYDRSKVNSIIDRLNQWQFVTKEVIISIFGEGSRFVINFEGTIISTKIGFNYKEELKKEINSGISSLKAIIESLSITGESDHSLKSNKETKKPMVFISHSSKDIDFVEPLVDLLEGIGLDETNLFCSSVPGYWVGLSKDIFEVLHSKFTECNLFVIFVHSPRFYQSYVSLNEMGAAWVLRTEHCSLLTQDMDFSAMTAVVNSHETAIKVNTHDAKARLTELKDNLVHFLGLQDITAIKWDRIRDKFLAAVVSDYQSGPDPSVLSQEYQRLMIEKMKEEQDEKKKAIVRGNTYPSINRGIRIIKIFNSGKSTARNVRIEWLNPSVSVSFIKPLETIEDLTPQNSREFRALLCTGCPETIRLRYTWDDDYQENNTIEESLQI